MGDMADPTSSLILRKLLSLDTPVARRIFELALLVGLIGFSAYMGEHYKSPGMIFVTGMIGVFGALAALYMLFALLIAIAGTAKKDVEGPEQDTTKTQE